MSRHRDAQRRSLDYCAETCPAVDAALEKIKEAGTYKLREALTQACQDLIDMESEAEGLAAEITRLQGKVSDLEYEVADLSQQLAAMQTE